MIKSTRIEKHRGNERGIALLVVLWVTVLMMVMGLSFSYLVRADVNASRTFREALEKKLISQAGIERGIVELLYRQDSLRKPDLEKEDICRIDGAPIYERVGTLFYALRINDEAGKIPLNSLTENTAIVLKNLLLNSGTAERDADAIVDSILDWKDSDESARQHGAESEYYISLPSPYRPRNSDFETLEELLLVKGIGKEILFGEGDRPGLIRYLTIYSGVNGININTASVAVLQAVPGIGPSRAALIVEKRSAARLTLSDIQEILAEDFSTAAGFLTDKESSAYELVSTGYSQNERDGLVTRAIVNVLEPDFQFIYYKCPGEK
jgi:general secretion pathway protein K